MKVTCIKLKVAWEMYIDLEGFHNTSKISLCQKYDLLEFALSFSQMKKAVFYKLLWNYILCYFMDMNVQRMAQRHAIYVLKGVDSLANHSLSTSSGKF